MKQTPLILFFTLSLTLAPVLTGRVDAGKGRSYSSGGSSSSRGSSSSFRGSSSSRSSGRSYSSGGSSAVKSAPAPSFSRSPAVRRSAGPSFDSAAAAAQRKQESKRSFEVRSTPQGRSYSGGSPARSGASVGRNYSSGPFDSAAAAAQRREESKAAFTQGAKPRPTYTASDGKTHSLDAGDKRVEEIRRDVDLGRWATREQRRRTVLRNPLPQPVVIYHDPYSNWFWWWLLTQDRNTRAWWAYHHQSDMDAARYRDLLAKDAQLQERIRELEAKKEPRDPTYAPPGLDRDLMYDDGFVEAAVNPQPPPPPSHSRRLLGAVWRIVLILAVMAFLVWLIFIKRWGGD